MTLTRIQGQCQGHGGPKMADFKVYRPRRYAVIKRITVNYDTPRQHLNFSQTDRLYIEDGKNKNSLAAFGISAICCKSDVTTFCLFCSFYPRDAMLARVIVIATCLSVRLSVTRRYCIKTKKASVMIFPPSGSPKTLVF